MDEGISNLTEMLTICDTEDNLNELFQSLKSKIPFVKRRQLQLDFGKVFGFDSRNRTMNESFARLLQTAQKCLGVGVEEPHSPPTVYQASLVSRKRSANTDAPMLLDPPPNVLL